jgi:murein DD-endopeptidase MepM/ murein hydrolase activator NlpD
VQTTQLPPPNAGQPSTVATGSGVSGGGRGLGSYQPHGQAPGPAVTGSVQGAPGQTHAAPLPAGRAASARPAPAPAVKTVKAKAPAAAPPSVHVVVPGDTLTRIARMYGTNITELARLNSIAPHTKLNIGDQIKVPGRTARAPRTEAPATAQPLSPPAKSRSANAKSDSQAAGNPPVEKVAVVSAAPEPETRSNSVAAASGNATFRWPAKGRIIAGFGPKTNGQQNDGINLALPEGTPVRAAEDGVVAYAGNELKGYGNLVLVRHNNGYVTAYAHAKELLVKRGDPIKRGQVIARSGQTGNVDAPQLHFEIRKGPTPLDPMPLLSGG